MSPRTSYCRAYPLRELRAFEGWAAGAAAAAAELDDDDTVYVWDDLTVVRNPVTADQQVLWPAATPQWAEFCAAALRFEPPGDLLDAPAEG